MSIKLSKILLILADILVVVTLSVLLPQTYNQVALLSVIVYAYLLITQIIEKKHADLTTWFLVLTFLYAFGQFFLSWTGYEGNLSIHSAAMAIETKMGAATFILQCTVLLRTGALLVPKKACTPLSQEEYTLRDNGLYNVAKIMLMIVFIPTVISLGEDLYQTLVYGYGDRITDKDLMNYGFDAAFDILADFMVPIIIALYLTEKGHHSKWVYVVCAVYCVAYGITGSRIDLAMLALVLAYPLFTKYKKKFRLKTLLLIALGGYLLLFLFTFISVGRSKDMLQISKFGDLANLALESEPITHMLREAGWTFVVIAKTISLAGERIPLYFGESYLSGVNMILPNIGGLTSYANSVPGVDALIKDTLVSGSGVGSSFIAEAYLNFGQFALPFMLILGMGLGKISTSFEEGVESRDTVKQFLALYAFSIVSFYVRSDTRTFLRFFIWYGVSLALLTAWNTQRKKRLIRLRMGRRDI